MSFLFLILFIFSVVFPFVFLHRYRTHADTRTMWPKYLCVDIVWFCEFSHAQTDGGNRVSDRNKKLVLFLLEMNVAHNVLMLSFQWTIMFDDDEVGHEMNFVLCFSFVNFNSNRRFFFVSLSLPFDYPMRHKLTFSVLHLCEK